MTQENITPRYFKEVVERWLELKRETVSYNTYATYKVSELYDYKIDKITTET